MAIFDAHPRDRLQVFIDGPNLFGTLRAVDCKIDYKMFLDLVKAETRLIRAQYFTTIRPQQDNEKFYSVLDFLSNNGYQVETKEVRDSIDLHGHMRSKGTMVGEMTAAMINAADNGTDHIVLFSGDGELTAAVVACKQRDTRVTVVSSERQRVISDDLRRECDQFIDVEDLPRDIFMEQGQSFRAVA
jgi:uncharacterized LabA/DUF88 family protein